MVMWCGGTDPEEHSVAPHSFQRKALFGTIAPLAALRFRPSHRKHGFTAHFWSSLRTLSSTIDETTLTPPSIYYISVCGAQGGGGGGGSGGGGDGVRRCGYPRDGTQHPAKWDRASMLDWIC